MATSRTRTWLVSAACCWFAALGGAAWADGGMRIGGGFSASRAGRTAPSLAFGTGRSATHGIHAHRGGALAHGGVIHRGPTYFGYHGPKHHGHHGYVNEHHGYGTHAHPMHDGYHHGYRGGTVYAPPASPHHPGYGSVLGHGIHGRWLHGGTAHRHHDHCGHGYGSTYSRGHTYPYGGQTTVIIYGAGVTTLFYCDRCGVGFASEILYHEHLARLHAHELR
jgi:hypothetical protein